MNNYDEHDGHDTPEQNKIDLRRVIIFSGFVLAFMYIVSLWAWVQIPAGTQVPIHWNVQGEVDGYGSKFWGLMLMPLMNTGIVLLFIAIPRLEPRRQNLLRSMKAYTRFWAAFLVFMLVLHLALVAATLGYGARIELLVPIMVGVLFIVIGNYMGKIRSNFMMGIRTPWTLTSELAWNKTHRLGGKLFMLTGGVTILAALFGSPEATFILMMAGVVGILLVAFPYSYLVWKNDPEAGGGE